MLTIKPPMMKTTITEVFLLGNAVTAGLSGLINDYGGFLVTLSTTIVLGVIRWQEHRANLRLKDLEAQEKEIRIRELREENSRSEQSDFT